MVIQRASPPVHGCVLFCLFFHLNTTARTSTTTAQPRHVTFCNNMSLRRSARGKRKAVDLAVCITPKKKKALGKAAAKEHGKNVVKQCFTNRKKWRSWKAKTHCLTTVPEIMDVNHLQELKDDVRPLSKGESVLRLLQQDGKKQVHW